MTMKQGDNVKKKLIVRAPAAIPEAFFSVLRMPASLLSVGQALELLHMLTFYPTSEVDETTGEIPEDPGTPISLQIQWGIVIAFTSLVSLNHLIHVVKLALADHSIDYFKGKPSGTISGKLYFVSEQLYRWAVAGLVPLGSVYALFAGIANVTNAGHQLIAGSDYDLMELDGYFFTALAVSSAFALFSFFTRLVDVGIDQFRKDKVLPSKPLIERPGPFANKCEHFAYQVKRTPFRLVNGVNGTTRSVIAEALVLPIFIDAATSSPYAVLVVYVVALAVAGIRLLKPAMDYCLKVGSAYDEEAAEITLDSAALGEGSDDNAERVPFAPK